MMGRSIIKLLAASAVFSGASQCLKLSQGGRKLERRQLRHLDRSTLCRIDSTRGQIEANPCQNLSPEDGCLGHNNDRIT